MSFLSLSLLFFLFLFFFFSFSFLFFSVRFFSVLFFFLFFSSFAESSVVVWFGLVWFGAQLPFSTFLQTHQGYVQYNQIPLNTRKIRTFGLVFTNKLRSDFQLDVEWIKATNDPDKEERLEREARTT